MLTLTFKSAKENGACAEGYQKFAKFKGGIGKWGKETPFTLLEVLNNNGIDDAIWALRCCEPIQERDRVARLFACDCAQLILPLFEKEYLNDNRPRNAIEVARKFANGEVSLVELTAASNAAWAAASNAAWAAASDAARDAAWANQEQMLRKYLMEEKSNA